jgi:hypothetical protein
MRGMEGEEKAAERLRKPGGGTVAGEDGIH